MRRACVLMLSLTLAAAGAAAAPPQFLCQRNRHGNFVRQIGHFAWQGAGYDRTAGNWIWQRPRIPNWPDVRVVVSIGGQHDDDDDEPDFWWDDRDDDCGGGHFHRVGNTPPPDLEPKATFRLSGYRVHFHLQDLAHADADDLEAHISGKVWSDSGLYAGLHMPGKEAKLQRDASGSLTGRVVGGMVGPLTSSYDWHCPTRRADFDLEFALTDGVSYAGAWFGPLWYGPVPGSTVNESLYWLTGADPITNWPQPGAYDLDWRVRLLPADNQPRGTYVFDPEVLLVPGEVS